jgi:hypothetical protein
MQSMLFAQAAHDSDTVTVRTLLSSAGAPSLIKYLNQNGVTPL